MGTNIQKLGGKLAHSPKKFITIDSPEGGVSVTALINPKEISFSKSVQWATQGGAGRNMPDLQFTQGDAIKVSLELLFDEYETGEDVRAKYVSPLTSLAMRNENLHRPPKVKIIYGDAKLFGDGTKSFVVTSVKVRYTMFNENGIPVRAVVTLDLQQGEEISGSANSPDVAKQRVLKRGETLQLLAESEYKDAGEWRRIADANHIDDPLSIEPGTKLLIPPIL